LGDLASLFEEEDTSINVLEAFCKGMPDISVDELLTMGDNIARQIEKRVSYKKATKKAISTAMRMGAEGIKIGVAGRLNGGEIARTEMYKEGRVPLHTLRAEIDYAQSTAHTTYGAVGVKVWICKGEVIKQKHVPQEKEAAHAA
jgi:small subunit ribosomal protein S3